MCGYLSEEAQISFLPDQDLQVLNFSDRPAQLRSGMRLTFPHSNSSGWPFSGLTASARCSTSQRWIGLMILCTNACGAP